MTTRLTSWDRAVKKRRAALVRALHALRRLSGPGRRRLSRSVNNMMYYGVMDRHQRHWHKIDGVWTLDSVRSRRLRR
jgi:hypothetical protein